MRRKSQQARMDERLSAYLDGELTARERAQVEVRLAADPELQAQLDALRRTVALVQGLPSIQAPRNFFVTPSMVAVGRPRPAARRWLAPALTFATAASALLCTVVLAGGLLAGGLRGPGAIAPAARWAEPGYEVALQPTEDEEGALRAEPTGAAYAVPEKVVEEEAESPAAETEIPLPAEAPPAPTTAPNLSATGEVTATTAASEAVGAGAPATETPSALPTPAPAEALDASATVSPTEVAPVEDEGAAPPTHPSIPTVPPTQQPRSVPLATPWLIVAGLAALTLALAVFSALAWRERER